MNFDLREIHSPIGPLVLATVGGRNARVAALTFGEAWLRLRDRIAAATRGEPAEFRPARSATDAERRLRDYFAGDVAALEDVSVDAAGTPFQHAVWSALRGIAPGGTASYADVARAIGKPRATRAVGLANGANPVCLIVPCHRVIASGGGLGGYGGGLDRKRWLLAHEGALADVAD